MAAGGAGGSSSASSAWMRASARRALTMTSKGSRNVEPLPDATAAGKSESPNVRVVLTEEGLPKRAGPGRSRRRRPRRAWRSCRVWRPCRGRLPHEAPTETPPRGTPIALAHCASSNRWTLAAVGGSGVDTSMKPTTWRTTDGVRGVGRAPVLHRAPAGPLRVDEHVRFIAGRRPRRARGGRRPRGSPRGQAHVGGRCGAVARPPSVPPRERRFARRPLRRGVDRRGRGRARRADPMGSRDLRRTVRARRRARHGSRDPRPLSGGGRAAEAQEREGAGRSRPDRFCHLRRARRGAARLRLPGQHGAHARRCAAQTLDRQLARSGAHHEPSGRGRRADRGAHQLPDRVRDGVSVRGAAQTVRREHLRRGPGGALDHARARPADDRHQDAPSRPRAIR